MPIETLLIAGALKAAAGGTLKYAFQVLKTQVDEARQSPPHALLCQRYFNIGKNALRALEQEVDEILVEAEYCDTNDKEEVRVLLKRIDEYAYVSRLIFVLQDAVIGIKVCQEVMAQDQDAFFANIPLITKNEQRERAVKELKVVLPKLEDCINMLIQDGLQWLPAGTGVCIKYLDDIKAMLKSGQVQQQDMSKLIQDTRTAKKDLENPFGTAKYFAQMDEINTKLALAFR